MRNLQLQDFPAGGASNRVGFYSWNLAENLVFGDEYVAEFYGFTPQEFGRGVPIEAILGRIHVDDRPGIAKAIHVAIVEGGLYRETYRIVRPDGGLLVVLASGRCFRDETDTQASWGGMITAGPAGEAAAGNALELHCRAALDLADQSGRRAVAAQLRTAIEILVRWT